MTEVEEAAPDRGRLRPTIRVEGRVRHNITVVHMEAVVEVPNQGIRNTEVITELPPDQDHENGVILPTSLLVAIVILIILMIGR